MQQAYWKEHSQGLTVEAMMLDSQASVLDKMERPEVGAAPATIPSGDLQKVSLVFCSTDFGHRPTLLLEFISDKDCCLCEDTNHRIHEEVSLMSFLQILGMLPILSGKDIVELGAGIGRFTSSFATLAKSVLAVDFMETAVEKVGLPGSERDLCDMLFTEHSADQSPVVLKYASSDGFISIELCCYPCGRSVFSLSFRVLQNKEANGHFPNASFRTADVTSLELPEAQTDLVFSNWLLMYLDDDEVRESPLPKKLLRSPVKAKSIFPTGYLLFMQTSTVLWAEGLTLIICSVNIRLDAESQCGDGSVKSSF